MGQRNPAVDGTHPMIFSWGFNHPFALSDFAGPQDMDMKIFQTWGKIADCYVW